MTKEIPYQSILGVAPIDPKDLTPSQALLTNSKVLGIVAGVLGIKKACLFETAANGVPFTEEQASTIMAAYYSVNDELLANIPKSSASKPTEPAPLPL